MLRRAGLLAAFAVFVLIAAVFAYGNRGAIPLELGFARIENVSIAGAFVGAFVLGGIFGLFCAILTYWRVVAEKRRLKRRLTAAEAELGRLRSAPLQHAD